MKKTILLLIYFLVIAIIGTIILKVIFLQDNATIFIGGFDKCSFDKWVYAFSTILGFVFSISPFLCILYCLGETDVLLQIE